MPINHQIASLLFIFTAWLPACGQTIPEGCKLLHTDNNTRIVIDKPGKYCLMQNLSSSWVLPGSHSHNTGNLPITITSGDVELDLMGHTLSRGFFADEPDGIEINDVIAPKTSELDSLGARGRFKNISVRNGTIKNTRVGITKGSRMQYSYPKPVTNPKNEYDIELNRQISKAHLHYVYLKDATVLVGEDFEFAPQVSAIGLYFAEDNLKIENVKFEGNRKDVLVTYEKRYDESDNKPLPKKPSSYPPCGGTDDFGRPMSKDAQCDDSRK